jgi:hypothetical protein
MYARTDLSENDARALAFQWNAEEQGRDANEDTGTRYRVVWAERRGYAVERYRPFRLTRVNPLTGTPLPQGA